MARKAVPAQAEDQMVPIRTLAGEYAEQDVYNMDETGLFWRLSPSSGLASQSLPGRKKSERRISAVLCANARGDDKLPLLLIGHAKQPRALRNVNIEAMGCWWRSNAKAWMTIPIMIEWLHRFYQHIGQRSVLLLMDNFSAHTAAVQLAQPPPNIRIQYLPPNATSRFQPLDQGIIANTKVFYRQQYLRYLIDGWDQGLNDSQGSITVYHAIRWISQAWHHDVSQNTINACFAKSTVIR